jgi:hypothetical protein
MWRCFLTREHFPRPSSVRRPASENYLESFSGFFIILRLPDLKGTKNPLPVLLTICNDSGMTSVKAELEH